ncbi:hypothetical protein P171DRAFT_426863 [Karstenula rhodostoma CBS 690.94]|uniref:Uncharacterized protein n=1 Tax=Karstenula rhodostoma CBS 690.94 TaxID=1392251 RepID=A0A9P4PSG2_9PLEO|nr:hypothetical protein P171DRAFT_426863 [Karstenula rhodostoma CBS 690.94]
MFSPTHAFLSAAAMEMASKKATTRNNSTFATNRESDSTKSPPGHSRGRSLADCGFNVDYDTKEVERLAQEIRDGTVAETLLELFVHWICKHEKNYDEARKYIRELNLDQVSSLLNRVVMRSNLLMRDIELRRLPYHERECAQGRQRQLRSSTQI